MEHLRDRLRNLLLLLLEALDGRRDGPDVGPAEMREMVAAAGYGDEDMLELLDWLRSRWEPDAAGEAWLSTRLVGRASEVALRQMGQREDELLTPAAFGYLLDLVRTGQITAEQMESLIQFAQLAPEGPLAPADLATLVDRVVFAAPSGWGVTDPGRAGRAH
jgi:hypothetical protein